MALSFMGGEAHADDLSVPLGAKHQLVLGELAGMRLSPNGTSFQGPLGFRTGSVTVDQFGANANEASLTTSYTSVWFAPSADFFVIDHLSVGGLFEISSTSSSTEVAEGNAARKVNLPTTTDFSALARVGYMIPIGEKFGIWPRGGLGFRSQQVAQTNVQNDDTAAKETTKGVYFGLDVNALWRPVNNVYFVLAPELLLLPGGSFVRSQGNSESSVDASAVQFSLRTGVGVLLDL